MHWFANHPKLALGWLRYNQDLNNGLLDPRLREIVILRVSWRYRSDYEWVQHVLIAAPLGIGPEHLAGIKEGPEAAIWTPEERDCLRAVDQLTTHHDIDDELWAALSARFDTAEMMETTRNAGAKTEASSSCT